MQIKLKTQESISANGRMIDLSKNKTKLLMLDDLALNFLSKGTLNLRAFKKSVAELISTSDIPTIERAMYAPFVGIIVKELIANLSDGLESNGVFAEDFDPKDREHLAIAKKTAKRFGVKLTPAKLGALLKTL